MKFSSFTKSTKVCRRIQLIESLSQGLNRCLSGRRSRRVRMHRKWTTRRTKESAKSAQIRSSCFRWVRGVLQFSPRAEIEVSTAERHNCLARGFVFAVLGQRFRWSSHQIELHYWANSVGTDFANSITGCSVDHRQVNESSFQPCIY